VGALKAENMRERLCRREKGIKERGRERTGERERGG